METFESLRDYRVVRINENKDRFIQKNILLTDDQKQEVLDFFHSHANLEAKVNNGNWNYIIPYEEFKKVMDSIDTEEKRLKKQTKELRKQNGLEGLVEGEDYSILTDTPEYTAYKPLTHKGMRVIASNMVEPKLWCKSSLMEWTPKEVLPAGEPMKDGFYPGAKWCVAMETDKHWNSYTRRGCNFIVVCSKNSEMEESFKKVCLVYDNSWKLSYHQSVTASDVSLKDVQSDYVEAAIEDLNTVLHGDNIEHILEEIRKRYHPKSGTYKLSKKTVSPRDLLRIGKLDHPVVWTGNFTLWDEAPVRSLEGCPEKVTGDFVCIGCQNLTSLEGAPKYVGGSFTCRDCKNLTSLKGAPEYVGENFDCSYCSSLTSLKGAPKRISEHFWCSSCGNLASLEGAPEYVRYFSCDHCSSLKSLEGAPKHVERIFDCSFCESLTSLEGAPESLEWNFNCRACKSLTSLKGAPKHIGNDFDCSHCKSLTSLEGAPKEVGGTFDCSDCKSLTSLKGAPEYVGREFDCRECSTLISLEGAPEHVGRDFKCYDCGKPFYKDVETLDTEAANFVV